MKRAAVLAYALALTTFSCGHLVYAEPPSATGGPTLSQAERDAVAPRVRGGQSCPSCDLFQVDLSYQVVSGRDFSGARIRQSDLTVAIADRTNFSRANLSLANMFGIRAGRADFSEANLEGATLVGGHFAGARFDSALLTGANLSGAELASAMGLTQNQLNTACGDATTTLPAGLTVPRCSNNQ